MKEPIKGFVFGVLVVMGGMALLAGNALCADEAMPPEVKALIGMKFTAVRIEGKNIKRAPGAEPFPPDYERLDPAPLPGWKFNGGSTLDGLSQAKQGIGVKQLYKDNLPIFVVDLIDQSDKSRVVLDAQVLPQELMNYTIKNGKLQLKRHPEKYFVFNPHCKSNQFKAVIGLSQQEENMARDNCTHWSSLVKRAWAIDLQSGKITKISPEGVSCYWETEFTCLSNHD